MVSIGLLRGHELEHAYYFAIGYTGFEYVPSRKCWRADLKLSEIGIMGTIAIDDIGCDVDNSAYHIEMSQENVLALLREENISLAWTTDKKCKLQFQALPEIEEVDESLITAYMRIIIRKELGSHITPEHMEKMNVFKNRTAERIILK